MNYNPTTTMATIMCCMCGVPVQANPANMCVNCIRTQVDISEGIPKQAIVQFCRGCQRYHIPPSHWANAELESAQLLAILLKRVKGLNKVRLVDAGFIWTEPHSKRIKIKLVIEKAVFQETILQHTFVIEFTVTHQYCDDCHRVAAKDHWNSIVQLRQKVQHKKTFFYIEQLIIKHRAAQRTTNIKDRPDGLDFYYAKRSDAQKLVDFLQSICPVKFKTSERLMSTDLQNSTANYKFTFSVEIVPVCKDDFLCLPLKTARALGNISQLVLVYRVGTSLKLVDPRTLQTAEISNNNFWRAPFAAICSYHQLVEFVILDTEVVGVQGKYTLIDVQVARARDLGVNDTVFYTRSHLGRYLEAGDSCMGYDLTCSNINNADYERMDQNQILPVILVKKHYPNRRRHRGKRRWKLDSLPKVSEYTSKQEEEKAKTDYESFMQDVEEDPEFRSNMHIFKDPNFQGPQLQPGVEQYNQYGEVLEQDFPEPSLEEMMEALVIEETPVQPEFDPMVPLNEGLNNPYGF